MPSTAPWRIELLGRLRAERDGQVVSRFRTEKTAALLGWLALHPERSHPREELIERFWPESDPQAGRAALSQALWSLRRQLEPPGTEAGAVIRAARSAVEVGPKAVTTDVAEMRTALAAATRAPERERAPHLERAVALYRGELLPGHLDDWAQAERERVREAFLAAARALAARHLADGQPARALEVARAAVLADPTSEAARRDLMSALAASGDPAAAEREYQALAALLEREIGVAPSAETRALAKEIARRAALPAAPQLRPAPAPASMPAPAPASVPVPGPSSPPPPAAAALPAPSLLPLDLTRFFGREAELDAAAAALSSDVRLLTLTGPGGIGKTRLAAEVARRLAPSLAGGAAFVPLADVGDPALVAPAIAEAARAEAGPGDPLERAAAALARRGRALLVLDNLEHLLPRGAALVRALLERVPSLAVLATSRRPLGLDGERELPLRPLAVPDGAPAAERLVEVASARLFVDRAQAARPDFQVTAANAPALAELLRRLEGIPLALAIAAGRSQVLSPAQILERMASRLDMPARGKDAPARHRTLRATIAWSHGLLAPAEQRLLARLSAFHGPFTVDAVEAVCAEPGADAAAGVAALRECSLLESDERGGEVRLRMLESVREFAASALPPGEREPLRARHAKYFAARVSGPDEGHPAWLARIALDLEDIRAALATLVATPGRAEEALAAASSLTLFWDQRGRSAEGRRHVEAALALAPPRSPLRAGALLAIGDNCANMGDSARGRAAYAEALALSREAGDRSSSAWALVGLSRFDLRAGETSLARARLEEAGAIYRETGERKREGVVANDLGILTIAAGDLRAARAHFETFVRINRETGGMRGNLATGLVNLGVLAKDTGDYAAARRHIDEAIAGFREAGDPARIATGYAARAALLFDLGEAAAARAIHDENVAVLRAIDAKPRLVAELRGLGRTLLALGDLEGARAALEECESLLRGSGNAQHLGRTLRLQGDLALARGRERDARERWLEALGIVAKVEPRSGETATLLEAFAELSRRSGDAGRAARLLGAADALRASVGTPVTPIARPSRERLEAELRASLGEGAFEEGRRDGAALSLEDAIALAGG